MTDLKQKIEKTIEELLRKMDVDHGGIEEKEVAGQVFYCIKADDDETELLIGEKGGVLRSINMIVGRMVDNHDGDRTRFIIDVNDYKKIK